MAALLILRNSTLPILLSHTSHYPLNKPFTGHFSFKGKSLSLLNSSKMESAEITEEVEQKPAGEDLSSKKKIFVAGATGSTGKRIVEQLLAKGFAVKAGVRDLDKAKATLSHENPALQIVKADVTEGSVKLVEAIGDDSEAVICATGFRPGWDLFAPWKDTLYQGTISRDQVAEVAVEALAYPEASYKVVEIVSRPDAPKRSYLDLFGSIRQK